MRHGPAQGRPRALGISRPRAPKAAGRPLQSPGGLWAATGSSWHLPEACRPGPPAEGGPAWGRHHAQRALEFGRDGGTSVWQDTQAIRRTRGCVGQWKSSVTENGLEPVPARASTRGRAARRSLPKAASTRADGVLPFLGSKAPGRHRGPPGPGSPGARPSCQVLMGSSTPLLDRVTVGGHTLARACRPAEVVMPVHGLAPIPSKSTGRHARCVSPCHTPSKLRVKHQT